MKSRWLTILSLLISTSAWASNATYSSYLVKDLKQLTQLKKQIEKPGHSRAERAWLRWQYALNAPQFNFLSAALSVLKDLEASKQKLVGQDHIDLTRGRILFQQGKFDEAIEAYQSVPKASEYWFEAMEEEAWSYIRLNESSRATAKLATLMTPLFSTWVGPETYFAANYNALKICDYSQIFKNGKTFKSRQANRIAELEKLASTGSNSQSAVAVQRLETGEMRFMAFAKEAEALPRFFWRDEFLRRFINDIRELKELDDQQKEIAEVRRQMSARLQTLAKAELSEYRTVIQKLQIIEAEAIQRLYLDESLKGPRTELAHEGSDSHVLIFSHDDDSQKGELWLDEVDRLQAKVKACPQLREAKL